MVAGFKYFWYGPERWWNLFDSIIVMSSLLEIVMVSVSNREASGLAAVRTVRLVRIVRIIRFTNHIPLLSNLRTMLHSLTNCAEAFTPALLLLSMVMYIFGLSFMQGCKAYVQKNKDDGTLPTTATVDELEHHFGSLAATFWTLSGMVSGGVDWLDVSKPIRELGPFYVISLISYIIFVMLGVMNILTGIFVNAAHQACALNREIAIAATICERNAIISELTRLFLEVLTDSDDPEKSLSWAEFESKFSDERINAYFLSLDLDMSSVIKVCDLMDADGNGQIGLTEFVEACVNYRGNAKAVDFVIMQRQFEKMSQQLDFLEVQMAEHVPLQESKRSI